MRPLEYRLYTFEELSLYQLYDIMALRIEVFVIEQNCPYQDADGKDQESYHVLGTNNDGQILAYTRLVPPGVSYPQFSSIGRVVNSKKIRGQGEGQRLMRFSVDKARVLWPDFDVKISAQVYLLNFYNSLGFKEVGEGYLEDNIPHIAMIQTNGKGNSSQYF